MLNIAIWRGEAAPPFEPPASRAAAGAAGGLGAAPPEPRRRCGCVAVRAAAAGDGAERTWTAPALAIERERSRQIGRIGNNLNQLARWANTHAAPAEAVAVMPPARRGLGPGGGRLSRRRPGLPVRGSPPSRGSGLRLKARRSREPKPRLPQSALSAASRRVLSGSAANTGRAVGELVDPPPRSVVEHPSRRDCWAGATPRGRRQVVQTHLPPNPYQALGLGGRLSFPFLGMSV